MLLITGIRQVVFANQANRSVITHNGKEIEATLLELNM